MSAVVFAPAGMALPTLPDGTSLVTYSGDAAIVAALGEAKRAVLVSDAVADRAAVAEAIRTTGAEVIEVESARWEGETHSALTEACRGVIAGFGTGGVLQAVAVFEAS